MSKLFDELIRRGLPFCLLAAALPLAAGGCAATVGGIAGDAAYTASEERNGRRVVDDNVVKLKLNKRLIDEGLGLFKDVSTVVYAGRVLLLGSVEDADAGARAGAIAAEVGGVREVINEIEVASEVGIGSFISDVVIEKTIQTDYLFDDAIDSANFRVRSVNQVVYLIGLAASEAELEHALAVAGKPEDVRRVVNHVEVAARE